MNIDEISTRIAASTGMTPSGMQRELLEELMESHRRLEVLHDDKAPSLLRACSDAAGCWSGVATGRRPSGLGKADPSSENGCILLPWIGPSYERGGICVIGNNIRTAGDFWEYAFEYRLALSAEHGQVPQLRRGKNPHGSRWARHTMRDVVAVRRSMRDEADLGHRNDDELADAMLASARLQAVKCSPIGGLSRPTAAMQRRCPSRYLSHEISVIRPSTLLVYGVAARRAVGKLGALTLTESTQRFRRGTLQLTDFSCEVFFLRHPAHGGWHHAHRELVASLEERPALPPP